MDTDSFEEKPRKVRVQPWWKFGKKWPEKPDPLCFRRVHQCSEEAPWCTYVLEHESTVAASSLGHEDLKTFEYQFVRNQTLLAGYELLEGDKRRMEGLCERVEKRMRVYSHVVPYREVQDRCRELQKKIMSDHRSTDLYEMLDPQAHPTEGMKEVIELQREQHLKHREQMLMLHREQMLVLLQSFEVLEVRKEVQRNDWLIEYLGGELKDLGFMTTTEFSANKFSIFGKSRPDMAFYKTGESFIKVGIILDTVSDEEVNLFGAAVEFKMDISQDEKQYLPQAFADMNRVSNDILIDVV